MDLKITSSKTFYTVNIFIDGLIHVQFKTKYYRGLYSYLEGDGSDRKWFIEIYQEGIDPMVIEYNSAEKWVAVLNELTKLLA